MSFRAILVDLLGGYMTQYYRIADLVVAMDYFGRTVKQAEPYKTEPAEADMVIRSDWQSLKARQSHLSEEDCEYLSTGASFYYQLTRFDGMLLHSSAVVLDGFAYLFTAPCGTGKSTHTALWQKVFGDRAVILNDDKPALRRLDGKWYAYGTPWSGKHDKSINMRVPLGGICVLARGAENKIAPFGGFPAIHALMEQTTRQKNAEFTGRMLSLLDTLLTEVPVFRMECNMDPDAARLSHRVMSEAAMKGMKI